MAYSHKHILNHIGRCDDKSLWLMYVTLLGCLGLLTKSALLILIWQIKSFKCLGILEVKKGNYCSKLLDGAPKLAISTIHQLQQSGLESDPGSATTG